MTMLTVDVGLDSSHEYVTGISVGEIIRNVHGKKSGAVAATVDGVQVDLYHEIHSKAHFDILLFFRNNNASTKHHFPYRLRYHLHG